MNININNYEEFFLLYADKELTPQQQRIVEMFVASNPHLKKEFEEILATVQQPGEVIFESKSALFKTASDDFIDRNNYLEQFVAYHDGELPPDEQRYVLEFARTDEGLQAEFDLIGQARMYPDPDVTFPDKHLLYKKRAPVISMLVIRIAAAAMLAGAVLWFGINQLRDYHPDSANQPVVATTSPGSSNIKATDQKNVTGREEAPETEPVIKPEAASSTSALKNQYALQDEKPVHKTKATISGSDTEAKAAEPETVVEAADASPKTEVADAIVVADLQPRMEIRSEAKNLINPDRELLPKHVERTVTYATFASNEPVDEYVFLDIPAENFKRSKVGILIKKVKRTIDRNNPINRLLNADEME